MLVSVLLALAVCLLVLGFLAAASLRICRRLGLDPVRTLLWLGLLEHELSAPRKRRRRLGELAEAPPRRRVSAPAQRIA